MTIDEFADFEIANGADVVKVENIWWRGIRPFFYQPLFPFLEVIPNSIKPPPKALFGGFQHSVADPSVANSVRHFFIYDDIPGYTIDTMNHQRKRDIKRGINFFSIKKMEDIGEFISSGYPVYRSFYERTKYSYKKERIDKKYFSEWAETLYRFPKVKILGAYHLGELCAVDVSYLVEDTLFDATCFSKTEYVKKFVNDLIIHTLREKAALCPHIRRIYKGAVTGIKSLDFSKIIRGCKIVTKPAFYRLNPVAHIVLKVFMNDKYKKLLGFLPEAYKPKRAVEAADVQG